MTRDRARKAAVHQHAQATGESYTRAGRTLTGTDTPPAPVTVWIQIDDFHGPSWGGYLHSHGTSVAITARADGGAGRWLGPDALPGGVQVLEDALQLLPDPDGGFDLVPDSSAAQSLAAFHGEPNLAYNETRSIWDNDAVYSRIFRDSLTARHIVYTYGLLKAIERAKQKMLAIPEGSRTDAQKRHAAYFSARGSNYLLVAAVGSCIETMLGTAVSDRYSLRFRKKLSPAEATQAWQPVIDVAVAFSTLLAPAADRGLTAQANVKKALEDFGAMLEAARSANPAPFDTLAAATEQGIRPNS
jgi:hypothetical protein